MLEIAVDKKHERQFEALKWCVERIYGKAPLAAEDVEQGDGHDPVLAILWRRAKGED